MDVAGFKSIVEANGGEDKVLAITFDNSSGKTFTHAHEPYSHAEYLDEANECFKFPHFDLGGNLFYVIKPVECIQAIHFVGPNNKRTDYDKQTVCW